MDFRRPAMVAEFSTTLIRWRAAEDDRLMRLPRSGRHPLALKRRS
jgi:hypothetical protein